MSVTRRNRQTGTLVTVARADEIGADPIDPWLTICEAHNEFVGHPSKRLAVWHAADPAGWCYSCRTIVDSKEARRG